MNPELAYFLKVNVGIALLYAFYRLFFNRDTFFHWRRVTLFSIVIVSILYPLPNIQDWIKEQGSMAAMVDFYSSVLLPEVTADASAHSGGISGKMILSALINSVYWGIAFILLIRFLIQLAGIIKLGIGTRTAYIQGVKTHILPKAQGPFSFFKWIFVHPSAHTEEEIDEILTHELTHVKQWHSVDVIVSELLCIICWFNPFLWLLKREIRNNLEYLADHEVLENGYDHKIYQYHLLGLAHQKSALALSNSFNILPLKNRIRMMNKKRTKQIGRTKYLLFIPLVGLLLVTSNVEALARTTRKMIGEVLEKGIPVQEAVGEESVPIEQEAPVLIAPRTDQTAPAENVVFEVVEEMPTFPGGQQELMKFLTQSVKYPLEAQKNGIQGRVIIQFVVDKEGNIDKSVIVRKVSPEIDAEALRVINSMPRWIPGKQRGKPVNVRYTVPVTFRLQ